MYQEPSKKELLDEIKRLEKTNQELEDSIKAKDERIERIRKYGRFLAHCTLELVQLTEDMNIHDFCALKLKELLPRSTVYVSAYDERSNNFFYASVQGMSDYEKKLMEKLMGKNYLNAQSNYDKLGPEIHETLLNPELRENPQGIYLATGKVFPKKLCNVAEKLFGVTGTYGMGLSWDNQLYGSVAIFSLGEDVMLKKDLIETIINMTAVALQRRQAEEQIKKTLKEKELLMREIHHRSKNNLMVISSILNLQSQCIKDSATRAVFKEGQDRARSMALIHEKLYSSTDLKRIDFGEYVSSLTLDLFKSYVVDFQRINLDLNVENHMIDVDNAIPLGLIINELITNCIKYAFPENRKGTITVEFLKKAENFTLVIADNGVGVPQDFDFQMSQSLGLQIVNKLTSQIHGNLEMKHDEGTKFIITFQERKFAK